MADNLPQKRSAAPPSRARAGNPRVMAVGSFLPRLTAPSFRRYGFEHAGLISEWTSIVGKEFAAIAVPERLIWRKVADEVEDGETSASARTAKLVLRVDAAHALDVQYRQRQLMERINAFFGYRAVTEIRLVQAPLSPLPERQRPAAIAKSEAPASASLSAALDVLALRVGVTR